MISIPEPCHEDFNKMIPTERGAFCGKCKIDTFDFRNLSDLSINKIFLENKGEHLCGQFRNTQLTSLNRGFENWKNKKTKTFKSKFIFALLFVFGLSLFSCNQQEESAIIELQNTELFQTETSRNQTETIEYINLIDNSHHLNLIDLVEVVELDTTCNVRGHIEVDQYEEIDETVGEPIFYEEQIAGGLTVSDYWDYIEDTIQSSQDNTKLEKDKNNSYSIIFKTKAYPNPTIDHATLEIDIYKSGQFEIQVYDMAGHYIDNVFTGNLEEGFKTFSIELENQEPGVYIIHVLSQEQNETIKIQKME